MLKVESFGVIPFKKDADGVFRVLLILHSKGRHWGFPKGKPNPSETPLQSAKRELKEETGLDVVNLLKEQPLCEHYRFMHRRTPIFKTVSYFPALVEGDLQLQVEEIRDARWVSCEEAMQLLTYKEARHILSQSYALLR